jgi:hypothetical protein
LVDLKNVPVQNGHIFYTQYSMSVVNRHTTCLPVLTDWDILLKGEYMYYRRQGLQR